jgi:hypothetical protein
MLHIEPTASGNYVVKSAAFGRQLREQLGEKIRAVEMEARGLHRALYFDAGCRDVLMIRGVSDYADEDKSRLEAESHDAWRAFAAGNVARLLRAIWRRGPVSPLSPSYDLNLGEPGPHSRFRQEALPVFEFKRVGAQDLAFPALLCRNRPNPELALEVSACSEGETPATGFRGLCVVESPERQVVHGVEGPGGRLLFTLPASTWGLRVELLLSFPSPVHLVRAVCRDEFGRSSTATLRMPENQGKS